MEILESVAAHHAISIAENVRLPLRPHENICLKVAMKIVLWKIYRTMSLAFLGGPIKGDRVLKTAYGGILLPLS